MQLFVNLQRQRVGSRRVEWGMLGRFVATLRSGSWLYRLEKIFAGGEGLLARTGATDPTAAAAVSASQRLRESIVIALSHDLRGPLTSVVGLGELLLRSTPALAQDQVDLASAMRDEAVRMSEMVSNLLDILRIQNGGTSPRQEWHVLEEVVGSALRVTSQRLTRCLITTNMSTDLPLLRFDAVLIERVLVNLIENAAKFAGPDAHIGITAVTHGSWAEISVYDNGPGIPVGDETCLFERFSRCESTAGKPGYGLGLSICRAIVQAHGGAIWISPSPYNGAGLTFSLPMALLPPTCGL